MLYVFILNVKSRVEKILLVSRVKKKKKTHKFCPDLHYIYISDHFKSVLYCTTHF